MWAFSDTKWKGTPTIHHGLSRATPKASPFLTSDSGTLQYFWQPALELPKWDITIVPAWLGWAFIWLIPSPISIRLEPEPCSLFLNSGLKERLGFCNHRPVGRRILIGLVSPISGSFHAATLFLDESDRDLVWNINAQTLKTGKFYQYGEP
jgi:hypothetical protein